MQAQSQEGMTDAGTLAAADAVHAALRFLRSAALPEIVRHHVLGRHVSPRRSTTTRQLASTRPRRPCWSRKAAAMFSMGRPPPTARPTHSFRLMRSSSRAL